MSASAVTAPPVAAVPAARDRILDAADRLLGRFGYRKMTIDDLAREAGIGKGTVYLSFASKADVALACIDRMAARTRARLAAIADEPAPPADRLRRMLVTRVLDRFDYARGHSDSLDELLAALRARLLVRRARHFRAEAALLSRVLGEAGVTHAEDVAESMIVATNALLPYSLGARELGRRAEIARRADRLATLVLDGALPRPRSPRSPEPSARTRRRPS